MQFFDWEIANTYPGDIHPFRLNILEKKAEIATRLFYCRFWLCGRNFGHLAILLFGHRLLTILGKCGMSCLDFRLW
jgi:hypothetical protein